MTTERILAYLEEHGPSMSVDIMTHYGVSTKKGQVFFGNTVRNGLIVGEKVYHLTRPVMRYRLTTEQEQYAQRVTRKDAVDGMAPKPLAGVFRFNDPFERCVA